MDSPLFRPNLFVQNAIQEPSDHRLEGAAAPRIFPDHPGDNCPAPPRCRTTNESEPAPTRPAPPNAPGADAWTPSTGSGCLIRNLAPGVLAFLALACAALGADPILPPLPKDVLPTPLSLTVIPEGLQTDRPVPADNPLTEAKVQLGRRLFFDPILSGDGTVACASCHDPAHGLAAKHARAVGIKGQVGRRNAPSLFNVAYGKTFFWDGRAGSLEEQALKPIESGVELGSNVPDALKRLQADGSYVQQFKSAFSDGITAQNLAASLASFQRTLLHGDTKIDRFIANKGVSLTPSERHGLWIFESRAQCWRCHSGKNFTDEQFHNTGVSWGKAPLDLGRFEVTQDERDRGKFKTPTLRGIAHTPPYMHDGSLATLEDVIRFYNEGGVKNPYLDPAMKPLKLTEDDVKDLVAFLRALSE